ncbi:MAG: thioesterase family protein [Pseudomonadota bacterium]
MERRGDDSLVWSPPFAIELSWLDANGHLDMSYYHVLFDRTVALALDVLEFGDSYRKRINAAVTTLETHVLYRHEVHGDDQVRVSFHLLGVDHTRLHAFQTMERAADGELLATSESAFVHLNLETRRAVPIPGEVRRRAHAMVDAQGAVEIPRSAGRRLAPFAASAA